MQERRQKSRIPILTILTVLAALTSLGLWQLDQAEPSEQMVSEATVTAVRYVRSGSVANAMEVSATFDSPSGDQNLLFTDVSGENEFLVGDKLEVVFPLDRPQRAVPAYTTSENSSLNAGRLAFSFLVGVVALFTILFTRGESYSRLTEPLSTEGRITT